MPLSRLRSRVVLLDLQWTVACAALQHEVLTTPYEQADGTVLSAKVLLHMPTAAEPVAEVFVNEETLTLFVTNSTEMPPSWHVQVTALIYPVLTACRRGDC